MTRTGFFVLLAFSAALFACSTGPSHAETPAPDLNVPAPGVLTATPVDSADVRTHEPSSPAVAMAHLDACDEGDAARCHAAALDAYYSPRNAENDKRAFELFKRACDAGYAPSCNGLGLLFAEGRGTEQDPVEAARLYRAACVAGATTGCEHLSQALRDGAGIARDVAAAERAKARARCVFEASLKEGDMAACPSL